MKIPPHWENILVLLASCIEICICLRSICIQVFVSKSEMLRGSPRERDHYHKFPRQLHLSCHYPTHLPVSSLPIMWKSMLWYKHKYFSFQCCHLFDTVYAQQLERESERETPPLSLYLFFLTLSSFSILFLFPLSHFRYVTHVKIRHLSRMPKRSEHTL